jgi:hypothetical protein
MTDNPHTGSNFDDFLKEEGLYEECSAAALKRLRLRQLAERVVLNPRERST